MQIDLKIKNSNQIYVNGACLQFPSALRFFIDELKKNAKKTDGIVTNEYIIEHMLYLIANLMPDEVSGDIIEYLNHCNNEVVRTLQKMHKLPIYNDPKFLVEPVCEELPPIVQEKSNILYVNFNKRSNNHV